MIEQVPQAETIIVPIGGGGLATGIGLAMRRSGSRADLIGVQAAACAPLAHPRVAEDIDSSVPRTIADGIAIKHPDPLTAAYLREELVDLVTVSDDEIGWAIRQLVERTKLVAEGAGAAALAAVLAGRVSTRRPACVVLSGGNVDARLLASILNSQVLDRRKGGPSWNRGAKIPERGRGARAEND